MSERIDLAGLRQLDKKIKPADFDSEAATLCEYYDDSSRSITISRLRELGLGLAGNNYPIQVSLLRRIIDRIAVVYSNPPTRWLVDKSGHRIDESTSEHQQMILAFERAQYDLAWRRVDRIRALVRQCVIRFYPSDAQKSVVCRIFTPDNVVREPNPGAGDLLENDRRFALRLDGKIWEYWEKTSDGWRMFWVDDQGAPIDESMQPFNLTNGISPFGEILPVQMIYDDWPGGIPWLMPRCSRRSWVDAINGIGNDLWALITMQAHDKLIYKTSDPASKYPTDTGPGSVVKIDSNDEIISISPNPRIAECQDVLESLIRLWMISEDLPSNELDKSKQVVTGATLKVQERPLLARMEAQAPLALRDEARAWEKFRAVHNRYSERWEMNAFDESTNLEVEIADMEIPTDTKELQEIMSRSIAIGSSSIIDYIMRVESMPRHMAIKHYERVAQDLTDYPLTSVPHETNVDENDLDTKNQMEIIDLSAMKNNEAAS